MTICGLQKPNSPKSKFQICYDAERGLCCFLVFQPEFTIVFFLKQISGVHRIMQSKIYLEVVFPENLCQHTVLKLKLAEVAKAPSSFHFKSRTLKHTCHTDVNILDQLISNYLNVHNIGFKHSALLFQAEQKVPHQA